MRGRQRRLRRFMAPALALSMATLAWLAWTQLPWDDMQPGLAPENSGRVTPPSVFYGPPNSVAVMLFTGPAATEEQGALAFGLSVDLLDRLSRVRGLQLTARNSSFFFRDPGLPLPVISERLQSRQLVSGELSVGATGLRLAVDLFDAQRAQLAWRGEYDLLPERAQALSVEVVDELLRQIPGSFVAPLPAARVAAPSAWLDHARGLYLADPLGRRDLAAAAAAFERALEQDPDLHEARLALAELWLQPGAPLAAASTNPEAARAAALEVLKERPDSARALGLMSHIRRQFDWDWIGAADAAQAAVNAAGADAGVYAVAGLAALSIGALEDARSNFDAAIQRDPLNLGIRLNLGLTLEFSDDHEGALSTYRQLLSLNPRYPGAHAFRARVKALQGNGASARRESEQESDGFWSRYALILASTVEVGANGRPSQKALGLLDRMAEEDGAVAAFQVAELKAFAGDVDGAFDWLQRARQQRDGGMGALLGNPLLRKLHSDLRWRTLLADLRLPLDSDD